MFGKKEEFYNFKIKIDTRSEAAKALALKILKYIYDWKFVSGENEIIRLDITPGINLDDIKVPDKTITCEGSFTSYFVDFDGVDLISLGREVGLLHDGSYLSFYKVKNNCEHYLFGSPQERSEEYEQNDEIFCLPDVVSYELIADERLLTMVYEKNDDIEYENEDEEEFCEELLDSNAFRRPWNRDDFEELFVMHLIDEYEKSTPEYIEPFGCVGFSKILWSQKSNDFTDIQGIISGIKLAKNTLHQVKENISFRFDLNFTQSVSGITDKNFIYLFSKEQHKILRINTKTEEVETVTYS